MGTPIQTLPISAAALREVDMVGVFRYANTYPYGLSVLANNGVAGQGRPLPDVGKLITHRVKGLGNVKEAFELAGKGVDKDGKLIIKLVIETGSA